LKPNAVIQKWIQENFGNLDTPNYDFNISKPSHYLSSKRYVFFKKIQQYRMVQKSENDRDNVHTTYNSISIFLLSWNPTEIKGSQNKNDSKKKDSKLQLNI
jgi:hypothetical protein